MDAEHPRSIRPDELLAQLSWMKALARSLVRDPELADDVLQQVCLLALQKGPDASREGPGFRAWLASVTRRLASHSGRADQRRARRERAAARPEALPSTLESVQQREALAELVGALTGLDEPHYSTIVQRYFEGNSVEDLAASAAITPAAVRQRLSRAKQLLRERIEQRITSDRSGWLAIALSGSASGAADPSGAARASRRSGALPEAIRHLGGWSMEGMWSSAGAAKLVGAGVVAIGLAVVLWLPREAQHASDVALNHPAADAGGLASASLADSALPTPAVGLPAPLVPVAPGPAPAGGAAAGAPASTSSPLPGAGVYRLVVVDPQAHVVPWAIVETMRLDPPPPTGLDAAKWEPHYVTVTSTSADASGRCEIHLESDDDVLLARHDSLGASGLRSAKMLASALNADGDTVIALLPYLPVEGIVLDAVGSPATGSSISFRPTGSDMIYGGPRPSPPIVSGGDGRFSAYVDHSNQYQVRAIKGDLYGGRVINPKPGEPQSVTIQLRGHWSIGGTLVDAQGAPLAGVKIVAMRAQDDSDDDLSAPPPKGSTSTGMRECEQTQTKPDGSFGMPIFAAGRYGVIAIESERTMPDVAWVEVQGLEARPTVALVRPAATSISGLVVTAGNEPVEKATVEVRAAPPTLLDGNWFLMPSVSRTRTTRSHADGRFRLQPLPAQGEFEIRAYPSTLHAPGDDEVPWASVAAGSENVTLVVSEAAGVAVAATGSIRITVLSADPDVPVSHPRWDVLPVGATGSPLLGIGGSVENGVIVVPKLDPKLKYTVAVAADGLGGVSVPDIQPTPQGTELTVHLPAFGALTVTVVDGSGAPVPYAQVEITRDFILGRDFMTWGIRPQFADSHGVASFGSLDPGSYRVVVKASGQTIESTIEVESGGTTGMQLSLQGVQGTQGPH